MNRWVVAIASVTMMAGLGSFNAWSVFRQTLSELYGANVTGVNTAFFVSSLVFGLVASGSAILVGRPSPRWCHRRPPLRTRGLLEQLRRGEPLLAVSDLWLRGRRRARAGRHGPHRGATLVVPCEAGVRLRRCVRWVRHGPPGQRPLHGVAALAYRRAARDLLRARDHLRPRHRRRRLAREVLVRKSRSCGRLARLGGHQEGRRRAVAVAGSPQDLAAVRAVGGVLSQHESGSRHPLRGQGDGRLPRRRLGHPSCGLRSHHLCIRCRGATSLACAVGHNRWARRVLGDVLLAGAGVLADADLSGRVVGGLLDPVHAGDELLRRGLRDHLGVGRRVLRRQEPRCGLRERVQRRGGSQLRRTGAPGALGRPNRLLLSGPLRDGGADGGRRRHRLDGGSARRPARTVVVSPTWFSSRTNRTRDPIDPFPTYSGEVVASSVLERVEKPLAFLDLSFRSDRGPRLPILLSRRRTGPGPSRNLALYTWHGALA